MFREIKESKPVKLSNSGKTPFTFRIQKAGLYAGVIALSLGAFTPPLTSELLMGDALAADTSKILENPRTVLDDAYQRISDATYKAKSSGLAYESKSTVYDALHARETEFIKLFADSTQCAYGQKVAALQDYAKATTPAEKVAALKSYVESLDKLKSLLSTLQKNQTSI